jgi:predicted nucleic acid-binding protein
MIVYMDGSALAKRIATESNSELAAEVWRGADRRVASELVYSELGEVPGEILDELEIVATDDKIADSAPALVERHGLDVGESLHLATALSIDAPRVVVATWSRSLSAAAAEEGLAVVPRAPALAAA